MKKQQQQKKQITWFEGEKKNGIKKGWMGKHIIKHNMEKDVKAK